MLRIRPVRREDHKSVLGLAGIAGIGMSSLPQDAGMLERKITSAIDSFDDRPAHPKEHHFLFVLEDMATRTLAGTTGIAAHVGLSHPFYSYKRSTITQASSEIGVYSLQHVLHMVNDYTDATEIGSLFLHPDYRRDGIGKFLSRARYLMIAEFPALFSDVVISEIRGVQNAHGHSPFYDHLARHFFKMDFKQADYIYATQGSQFIADLMPRYPIYTNLLAAEAQAVIGVPLEASRPALELLKAEGFRFEGYIDLFDAGPTVQVLRQDIRTVRKSRKAEVVGIHPIHAAPRMVCTTDLARFYIAQGPVEEEGNGIVITPDMARVLEVDKGDSVRYAP